jgi:predicted phosphodiesterase
VRTALVSDVHGNAVAFRAVVDELDREGIDRVVCLGDMLQGGPEPAACHDLLRERGWPVVLGNADAFLIDPTTAEGSQEPITQPQLDKQAWALERIGPERAAEVAVWPITVEADLGHGRTLLAFHAVPSSYETLVFPTTPAAEFRAVLGELTADVAACGHIHLPYVRRLGATLVLNPGSVGLAYDHEQDEETFRLDPWASYAVVTSSAGALRIEHRRVAFDVGAVVEAIRACGMPHVDDTALPWERADR